jgi:hypothetical protein
LRTRTAAGERRAVGLELLRKVFHVRLDQVVFDVREQPEPEIRELVQDLALVRNPGRQDDVEGRDAVARDEQDRLSHLVKLADLSSAREAGTLQVGFGDRFHRAQT